jgi:hypothetical protein
MYVVNSNGETVNVNEAIRFMNPESKLERMKVFAEIIKNNFGEDVDFTFAHQPFYTNDAVIFFCRTRFSSASRIVNQAMEIQKHLDEPIEKIDLMKSLFTRKEDGKVCWYCLLVGMFIAERNLYDCNPVNITYTAPVPYMSFLRSFNPKLITEEEMQQNKLSKKYALLGGLDLGKPALLLEKAFDRDYDNGFSEKDQKMIRFANAWKKQKTNQNGVYSNIASLFLAQTQKKRKDCYPNYCDLKNFFVKNYKRSTGIRYKDNVVTATLPDGEQITVYIFGTVQNPKYVIGGQMVSDLAELKRLIDEQAYKKETDWFVRNVKPFL